MTPDPLDRRSFQQLALAACGGILAGSLAGCGNQPPAAAWPPEGANLHACRGLNLCKGLGKGAGNACAGQGACATAAAHSCSGENACKFQGGCGKEPSLNACKGQGGCGVPMEGNHWAGARKKFEKKLAEMGKTAGPAPAAP